MRRAFLVLALLVGCTPPAPRWSPPPPTIPVPTTTTSTTVPLAVLNDRWVMFEVSAPTQDAVWYLDRKTVQHHGDGLSSAWTRMQKADGTYTLALQTFDCPRRQMRLDQLTTYTADGHVGNSYSFTTEPVHQFQAVVPGTIEETLADLICKHRALYGPRTSGARPGATAPSPL